MAALRAAIADLLLRGEHAVHGALRAVIDPFVEQRRVDLRGGEVDEARRVEDVEHLLALPLAATPARGWAAAM